MSNVTVTIGGRDFTVASAAGEEDHVAMLGRLIDDRLRELGGAGGQSESRMLLIAALVLADDLHEARKSGDAPAPAEPPKPAAPTLSPETAERIEAIAERIEKLAAHLEEAGQSA